ncbi:related to TFC1 TFIIIC (transcription initiation factor) subunit, 95 kD [Phialocephala subalpina]|uniref:Related to TFC1 TFIIIC (Transcription initiation factor) subunit, 95 kD n=1 Tax=Phialocephala subalpina TaxID=576137 RepID=A0A1L7XVL6_9HELO|nr:related to TFC1 TFIIIC (transcription initiation factor) subunit, 95 kD [Phialocephala subalpina]
MDEGAAPVFKVPEREIIAVEHPMIVQNIDNGIKTFGNNHPFQRIVESSDAQDIVPLYLRYDDPMVVPIYSHNSATNNLLLKITVPKRIGKKRKRGTQEPSTGEDGWIRLADDDRDPYHVQSHSRMDKPASLLRKLRDNKGKYAVEVAGEVTQSHRYRGISDFHHSTSNTVFMPKFRDTALAGNADKLREFKLDPSRGWKPNEDFLPGPILTTHTIPFNWGWHQNPNIFEETDQATGQVKLVNRQGVKKTKLEYLSKDTSSIPMGPHMSDPIDNPELLQLIMDLRQALEERPLYTRRALVNRVGSSPDLYLFKDALQHVGYQFKGGPFRDCVIKFGVDPRSDPKYRQYQTLFFKLYEEEEKVEGMQWKDVRTSYNISKKGATKEDRESHIFDGKTLVLDGKIWQMCDITDPLMARLVEDSPYRDKCDNDMDGWFPEGSMAKIRAIMKVKLVGVRIQKDLRDEDFANALAHPDFVPGRTSKRIYVPVPDIRLTPAEIEDLKQRGLYKIVQSSGISKKNDNGKPRAARIRKHNNLPAPKRKSRKRALPGPPKQNKRSMPEVSTAPASWNLPSNPDLDPSRDNEQSASDAPIASIENDMEIDDVEEDEEDSGSDEDEETDIEQDEISDGAGDGYDSDGPDIERDEMQERPGVGVGASSNRDRGEGETSGGVTIEAGHQRPRRGTFSTVEAVHDQGRGATSHRAPTGHGHDLVDDNLEGDDLDGYSDTTDSVDYSLVYPPVQYGSRSLSRAPE